MTEDRDEDLRRIRRALERAAGVLARFTPSRVGVTYKAHGSPVTEADLAVDEVLRRELPRSDEGWLSEETPDDASRLEQRRVWIVDPLDGTREFLAGVPQWCISIGLAEDGRAMAGGVYNPTTDELFLGSLETGTTLNGQVVRASARTTLEGANVLVNRWALKRHGAFADAPFEPHAVGPLAYALALIAAGRADAMWSRSSKPEWDIAAGAALIAAAGGYVAAWEGGPLAFNQWPPRASGTVAAGGQLAPAVRAFITASSRA
ncbi:MAG TPA: inositol monophosphatase family protein [Methylomirabilota bacterium]|nr:inositol monophosphatase family protein [Methylomirabilota bacterium]